MSKQRVVLQGVPRVNFYEGGPRCPEDIILPSVMRSILEYLGEEDYSFVGFRCVYPAFRLQMERPTAKEAG